MPFIVQPPPAINIPTTSIELTHSIGENQHEKLDSIEFNKEMIDQLLMKERFQSLLEKWESETIFSSSIYQIIENVHFKQIVQMDKNVIPYIIDEIDKRPSNLVWALNMITGATINTTERITVSEACKTWVKLFKTGKIHL
jgi:hypothetical protein